MTASTALTTVICLLFFAMNRMAPLTALSIVIKPAPISQRSTGRVPEI